ncbi:hypothetical protein LBMAG42_12870 [Deltaproteobacteria bacterium]|nr:hypothetical protein LBMAG42_12870 [Deltaproteobacteria bacterium]
MNVLLALAGSVAALGLAECGLRTVRGGGHGPLPIYASTSPPALIPTTSAVGLLGARQYSVHLDARGLRTPSSAKGTVLLGDSLAFGLGLDDDETLAARCIARGHPMLNAAAPGWSAIDALDRAESLGSIATDCLLIVNPYDDDAGRLADRSITVNGWLLAVKSPPWARRFYASPFAGWQIPQDVVGMIGALRRAPEPRVGFASVGARIRAFVDAHPETRVVWGGYPSPTLPDGRAVATVRDEVGAPMIDLELHDAWLDRDLHWSARGVEQVAEQLCP